MPGCYLYNVFCLHGVFGLLTHSLFVSIIVLHSAWCFLIKWFSSFYVHIVFLWNGYVPSGQIELRNNRYYYLTGRFYPQSNPLHIDSNHSDLIPTFTMISRAN